MEKILKKVIIFLMLSFSVMSASEFSCNDSQILEELKIKSFYAVLRQEYDRSNWTLNGVSFETYIQKMQQEIYNLVDLKNFKELGSNPTRCRCSFVIQGNSEGKEIVYELSNNENNIVNIKEIN